MRLPAVSSLAVILFALAACGSKPPGTSSAGPGKKPPPVPVRTEVATRRDVPLVLRLVGQTAASELVLIRPQVTGLITTVNFKEGDTVAEGTPLFNLDDRPYAGALKKARADLAQAKAIEQQAQATLARDRLQLALAGAEVKRLDPLIQQGIASAQQIDQTRTAAQVAEATVAASEAALATATAAVTSFEALLGKATLDHSFCTIKAPIAGVTGAVGSTPGNLALAGQGVLVTIARMQPMHVGFALPARELAAVRAARARGPLAVAVWPEGGGEPSPGTLDLIENQISGTATVRLRAVCPNAGPNAGPNAEARLWPGQQCQVELTLGVEAGVVTVPETALQAGQNGSLVWIVGNDQTVSPRPVTVARTWMGVAVIAKGIEVGERVVTDGQLTLVRGRTVAVIDPAKPLAGSPPQPGSAAVAPKAEARPPAATTLPPTIPPP